MIAVSSETRVGSFSYKAPGEAATWIRATRLAPTAKRARHGQGGPERRRGPGARQSNSRSPFFFYAVAGPKGWGRCLSALTREVLASRRFDSGAPLSLFCVVWRFNHGTTPRLPCNGHCFFVARVRANAVDGAPQRGHRRNEQEEVTATHVFYAAALGVTWCMPQWARGRAAAFSSRDDSVAQLVSAAFVPGSVHGGPMPPDPDPAAVDGTAQVGRNCGAGSSPAGVIVVLPALPGCHFRERQLRWGRFSLTKGIT